MFSITFILLYDKRRKIWTKLCFSSKTFVKKNNHYAGVNIYVNSSYFGLMTHFALLFKFECHYLVQLEVVGTKMVPVNTQSQFCLLMTTPCLQNRV